MQLEEDDIIIVNYKKLNFSPQVKKKDWYDRNKNALLVDGWRLPTRMHFEQILEENEIIPFKKERKKKKEENKEE